MVEVPRPDPFADFRLSARQPAPLWDCTFPEFMARVAYVDEWVKRPVDDLQHLMWGRFHPPIATHRFYRAVEPMAPFVFGDGAWAPLLVCRACGTRWRPADDLLRIPACRG